MIFIERQIDGYYVEWPDGLYQDWYGTPSHFVEHLVEFLDTPEDYDVYFKGVCDLDSWESIRFVLSGEDPPQTIH